MYETLERLVRALAGGSRNGTLNYQPVEAWDVGDDPLRVTSGALFAAMFPELSGRGRHPAQLYRNYPHDRRRLCVEFARQQGLNDWESPSPMRIARVVYEIVLSAAPPTFWASCNGLDRRGDPWACQLVTSELIEEMVDAFLAQGDARVRVESFRAGATDLRAKAAVEIDAWRRERARVLEGAPVASGKTWESMWDQVVRGSRRWREIAGDMVAHLLLSCLCGPDAYRTELASASRACGRAGDALAALRTRAPSADAACPLSGARADADAAPAGRWSLEVVHFDRGVCGYSTEGMSYGYAAGDCVWVGRDVEVYGEGGVANIVTSNAWVSKRHARIASGSAPGGGVACVLDDVSSGGTLILRNLGSLDGSPCEALPVGERFSGPGDGAVRSLPLQSGDVIVFGPRVETREVRFIPTGLEFALRFVAR